MFINSGLLFINGLTRILIFTYISGWIMYHGPQTRPITHHVRAIIHGSRPDFGWFHASQVNFCSNHASRTTPLPPWKKWAIGGCIILAFGCVCEGWRDHCIIQPGTIFVSRKGLSHYKFNYFSGEGHIFNTKYKGRAGWIYIHAHSDSSCPPPLLKNRSAKRTCVGLDLLLFHSVRVLVLNVSRIRELKFYKWIGHH